MPDICYDCYYFYSCIRGFGPVDCPYEYDDYDDDDDYW